MGHAAAMFGDGGIMMVGRRLNLFVCHGSGCLMCLWAQTVDGMVRYNERMKVNARGGEEYIPPAADGRERARQRGREREIQRVEARLRHGRPGMQMHIEFYIRGSHRMPASIQRQANYLSQAAHIEQSKTNHISRLIA